jgi:hypothetical protein
LKHAYDSVEKYFQPVHNDDIGLNFVLFLLLVAVGYQYDGCQRIFWETRSATMSGYDISSSEIGGWNLNIHHMYNFQEGETTSRYSNHMSVFSSEG